MWKVYILYELVEKYLLSFVSEEDICMKAQVVDFFSQI